MQVNTEIRIVEENSIKVSQYDSYRVPMELSSGEDLTDFINSLPK